ncbi:uncharacterized protein LOC116385435 [Anarrhichthys ocellatus]|uniref:uncharacterized protein LOC116385435 n=1 Tax=Anarrhichthys ocellatus TaxID=433405 RepID=UPI0012EEBEF3|nr:uncharacterized protein LOC116385435 [Anarrhichthys ocellatus]
MKSRTALTGLFIIIFLRIKAAEGPELREKHGIELQCPPAMEAHPGEIVIRFLIKSQIDVCKYLTVECLYWDAVSKTPVEVFLVHRGKEQLQNQDQRFKGKADLLHEKTCSGNLSLNLTLHYPGTYDCTVEIVDVKKINCSTNLTVREQDPDTLSNQKDGDKNSVTKKQSSDPGTFCCTTGCIIVTTVVTSVIICKCFKRHLCSCCSRMCCWTHWREGRHGRTRTRTERGRLSDPVGGVI